MFRLSSGVDTKQARVRNPAPYLLFSDYMHQHLRGSRNKLEMFNGLLGRVAQACIRAERLLESKVELLHRVHVAAHLQGDTLPACVQADSIGASPMGVGFVSRQTGMQRPIRCRERERAERRAQTANEWMETVLGVPPGEIKF